MEKRRKLFSGKSFEFDGRTYEVGFLEGEYGKRVIEQFLTTAKSVYPSASILLNSLFLDGDHTRGTTPYAVVLLNEIVRQDGLRVATQADYERILASNALNLRGVDVDTSLLLQEVGINHLDAARDPLFRDLEEQLQERGPFGYPTLLPLASLGLVNSSHDLYPTRNGLTFILNENAQPVYAPVLSVSVGNFRNTDVDLRTGLPTRITDEELEFYRPVRLRGYCLSRLMNIGVSMGLFSSSDFDVSSPNGRIVLVGLTDSH